MRPPCGKSAARGARGTDGARAPGGDALVMATLTTAAVPAAGRAPAFRSILCGIDGSPSDPTVVRQAAALAGPGARIDLVSVVEHPVADTARILLTPARARRALRRAHEVAVGEGVRAREYVAEAEWGETSALLERCAGHDLLVVGSHGGDRAEGMLCGRTSTAAVHRAPCPVLVARPAETFPGTVLLADDGTSASNDAARVAAALAAQHRCEVLVAAPEVLDERERHRLADHVVTLREVTNRDPVIVDVVGDADDALPVLASRLEVSLLVLGSRRLQGVRSLASVSERVAHRARCSVLVVRS